MSTAFSVLRNLFALIGLAGCTLLAVLLVFNAAQDWAMRRRDRHLDEIHRAEAEQRRRRLADRGQA